MMPLFLLAAASADMDALGQAVDRCNRTVANPVFASETERRSQYLLDAYREQEAIVAARLSLAERRRVLREANGKKNSDEVRAVELEEALLEDRQRALNDKRLLEGIRRDTIDAMRRHFLAHCPSGKTKD